MPPISVHQDLLDQYILSMLMWGIFTPANQQSIELIRKQNNVDIIALLLILLTRYPNGRTTVPKSRNIHLAWDFAENSATHDRFINILCVFLLIFQTILTLIEEHLVFTNNSHNGQTPVEHFHLHKVLSTPVVEAEKFTNGAGRQSITHIEEN